MILLPLSTDNTKRYLRISCCLTYFYTLKEEYKFLLTSYGFGLVDNYILYVSQTSTISYFEDNIIDNIIYIINIVYAAFLIQLML